MSELKPTPILPGAFDEEIQSTCEVSGELLAQAHLMLSELGLAYTATDVVAFAGHIMTLYASKCDYTQRGESPIPDNSMEICGAGQDIRYGLTLLAEAIGQRHG